MGWQMQPTSWPLSWAGREATSRANVYEINQWLWQIGRGKPRLGGLSVAETEERHIAVPKDGAKRFVATRARRRCRVSADLQNVFCWTLMTRSKLRAVSASMSVYVSSWVFKRKIILKMMDHVESAARVDNAAGSAAAVKIQPLSVLFVLLPCCPAAHLERGRQTPPPLKMSPTYPEGPEHPDRFLHPPAAVLHFND